MLFALGLVLFVLGLFLSTCGIMLRKDGVRPWQFTPIWQARKYLHPPGPQLVWAGAACGTIGFILITLYHST